MDNRTRKYLDSPKGRASRLWNGILWRIKHRASYKNVQLNMNRDEFMNWVLPALTEWLETKSLAGVSVDRIKDGNYELGNLQLLDKRDNWLKAPNHKNVNAPAGMAWCHRCKDYLKTEQFSKNKTNWNGLHSECKQHRKN